MAYLVASFFLLLAAYALLSIFGRFSPVRTSETKLLILFVFGLAPLPFAAELYFLFLLLPGLPYSFYFEVICLSLIFPVLFWGKFGRQYCVLLCGDVTAFMRQYPKVACFLGGGCLAAVAGGWLACIVIPLINFDMLEYSVLGQQFLASRKITYHGIMYFPETGFYYRAFHSFLFPLFSSWGKLLSCFFGGNPDFFIKMVHYYYFLLQNLLCLAVLNRLASGRFFGWISGILLLNLTGYTVYSLGGFGIDAFRVYFLTASFLLLWRYLNAPSSFYGFLLVIFASIAANAHILGAFIVPFITLGTIGAPGMISKRLRNTILIGLGVLFFGYFHYFLQTFWGDGWIIFGKPVVIPLEDLRARGFNFPTDYFLKGYLGQFFNFRYFGLAGIITCPVIVYLLIHLSRLSRPGKTIFITYLLCSVVVGYFFYNFRYQYTLFPITILIVFAVVLQKKIIFQKFKKILAIVLIFNLFCLLSCFNGSVLLALYENGIDKIVYLMSQYDWGHNLSIEFINRLPRRNKAILGVVHNKKFNYPNSKKVILYYSYWEDVLYNNKMETLIGGKSDLELQTRLCSDFAYVILQHSYVPDDKRIVQVAKALGKLIYSDEHYKIYELPEIIQ